jgi:hypothetical protein
VNVNVESDGRWVLGDRNARCRHCNATAAVHYAANGRAELWHAPTDCCEYSRARERRFDDMRQREADRDERREAYLRSAA